MLWNIICFFLVTQTVWEIASNAKSDVKRSDGEDGLDEVRFELVTDLCDKSQEKYKTSIW